MKRIFQSLFILLTVTGCGVFQKTQPRAKQVTILAVNDMHAELDNFPRFAFIVDSLRGIYPELILVSGGDNQTGNPVNDMYQPIGWPMIALMNEVGFDLSAVGNHEFDSDVKGFEYLSQNANFPFLSANFDRPVDSELKVKPYHYMTLKDGTKIAFVSLLEVSEKTGLPGSHPDKMRPYTFYQPLSVVDRLDALADSVDLAVYVNHIGFADDQKLATMLSPKRFPLIIGGHSHTYVPDGTEVNGVHITQAKNSLAYTTLIRVQINPDGTKRVVSKNIPVGKNGNTDAKIAEMVESFSNSPVLHKVIAVTPTPLRDKAEIGSMLMDGLRQECATDFALINGGGVRVNEWPAGPVTVKQVYQTDPFGNDALIFRLTGQQLYDLIKAHCVGDKYSVCYPSGFRIQYRVSSQSQCEDIVLTLPHGEPLSMDRYYTVAMNSFLSTSFLPKTIAPMKAMHTTTADLIVQYLSTIKTVPDYQKEKRIKVLTVE